MRGRIKASASACQYLRWMPVRQVATPAKSSRSRCWVVYITITGG